MAHAPTIRVLAKTQKQARHSRHATTATKPRLAGAMDDRPARRESDPPLVAEPDVPPRSFSRASRRAADLAPPPPPEVHDFPFAFRELRRLTLEAETQFRWDSQQATWSQCAEHWRRRVHDMQLGDGDLDARLSRMLLGASTAAEPKHAPFFEASRVF